MAVARIDSLAGLESTYADELDFLVVPWQGAETPDPRVLVFNDAVAVSLGLDPDALRADAQVLSGGRPPSEASPVAMAYAGHQFGGYAPLLGDGRALLLGELRDRSGARVDLHLKGSGPTPFSRGGDGFASVGPMLREYLISEAMHALGIPTTRSLAVVSTGRQVMRATVEPGAVLARIAASHLRVGTFEFAVRREGAIEPLVEYAIARHHPDLIGRDDRYLAFFEAVVDAQASLVAQWMLVGFVHGVMNTDNTTISGQTIDYGPCAFVDGYDPGALFSSIDHAGRYAFGNQSTVLKWNLARFGETLLGLVSADPNDAIEKVTAVLETFTARYDAYFAAGMSVKLGLGLGADAVDRSLIDDLLALLTEHRADWTGTFRALAEEVRGNPNPLDALVPREQIAPWLGRWRAIATADDLADSMDLVNPIYIPRNHHVDEALASAAQGDTTLFDVLLDVVTHPFREREEWADYATPAPRSFTDGFQTFCGT